MRATVQRRPYLATIHPEGRWWHIRVPELGSGAVSQAARLTEVDDQVRDLISVWLDVPPDRVRFRTVRRSGLRPGWSDSLLAAYRRE